MLGPRAAKGRPEQATAPGGQGVTRSERPWGQHTSRRGKKNGLQEPKSVQANYPKETLAIHFHRGQAYRPRLPAA